MELSFEYDWNNVYVVRKCKRILIPKKEHLFRARFYQANKNKDNRLATMSN